MRSRRSSLDSSLLRLMILVLSALDNTVLSATMHNGTHGRAIKRIHLPRAVDIARRFTCKEPQPRAYNLKDLMQPLHENPGESANQPIYIVLKRCDVHSGCCQSPDMSCTPVESEMYYEDVEIEIWSLETNTRRQWIRVQQHGKCSCEVTNITDRYELEHQTPKVILI